MTTPPTPAGSPEGPRTHSDGDPRLETDADCQEAVAELYGFLDGALDESVMIQVEAHLRRCSPCLEAFDFEADLRRVIAAKCTEQVPPELRDRFCAMLRGLERGEVDGAGVPSAPERS